MASNELACVYAALILNDDNIDIDAEKINSILKAANVKVESYWVDLFVGYFKNHDISEMIKGTHFGVSQTSELTTAANEQQKEEENKEEHKEEEEVEMGGFDDLFN